MVGHGLLVIWVLCGLSGLQCLTPGFLFCSVAAHLPGKYIAQALAIASAKGIASKGEVTIAVNAFRITLCPLMVSACNSLTGRSLWLIPIISCVKEERFPSTLLESSASLAFRPVVRRAALHSQLVTQVLIWFQPRHAFFLLLLLLLYFHKSLAKLSQELQLCSEHLLSRQHETLKL